MNYVLKLEDKKEYIIEIGNDIQGIMESLNYLKETNSFVAFSFALADGGIIIPAEEVKSIKSYQISPPTNKREGKN